MKNLMLMVTFFFTGILIQAQSQTDTIYKMNGDLVYANVSEITETSVKYKYPGEDFSNTLSKNHISKIHFKSGRVEEFASTLNLVNVKSCLDWESVQFSNIESEVIGMLKIDDINIKAEAGTTFVRLGKIQSRAFNKIKMQTAMLGGNVCYIVHQNTEGKAAGRPANVSISAVTYTSKKVHLDEITFGEYNVKEGYVLKPNEYELKQISKIKGSFGIDEEMVKVENNFPILQLDIISKIDEYTIIYASQDELVLSCVYKAKKGKEYYYNIFLERK